LFDALRDTLERFPNLWVLEPSFPQYLTGLVQALRGGDEEAAVSITRNYYERVDRQLMALLHALAGTHTPSEAAPEAVAEHSQVGAREPGNDTKATPPEAEHDSANNGSPIEAPRIES
jgi:hypothetical protein